MQHRFICLLLLFCNAYAAELAPGLIGEYFRTPALSSDFPFIPREQKPDVKRVDAQIDIPLKQGAFAGTELVGRFYVRWSGVLRVASAGRYMIFTESDDGTQVCLDGKLVVENGGLHAMQEEEGEVELAAGDHRIKVEYIQFDGGAGCIMKWQPPGAAKEIVPPAVLLHDKAQEAADVLTDIAGEKHAPRTQPAEPPAEASLEEKVKSVLPREDENRWQSVQWRRNLQQARIESQLQGRPIFLWIMNGNPLGCT